MRSILGRPPKHLTVLLRTRFPGELVGADQPTGLSRGVAGRMTVVKSQEAPINRPVRDLDAGGYNLFVCQISMQYLYNSAKNVTVLTGPYPLLKASVRMGRPDRSDGKYLRLVAGESQPPRGLGGQRQETGRLWLSLQRSPAQPERCHQPLADALQQRKELGGLRGVRSKRPPSINDR